MIQAALMYAGALMGGSVQDGPADPLNLSVAYSSGSIGSSPERVLVDGSYAYVTERGIDRLLIYDISDPATASQVVSFNLSGGITNSGALAKIGDYVYIPTSAGTGFYIVDVSTPASPVEVSVFVDSTNLDTSIGIASDGSRYLFLTHDKATPGISVYDLSSPESPSYVGGALNSGGSALTNYDDQFRYFDGYLYECDSIENSLIIWDVSSPASPAFLGKVVDGTYLNNAIDVAISGNYAFVAADPYLTVVDISNKSSPSVSGNFSDAAMPDPFSVVTIGDYAYVGNKTGGPGKVNTVDISNPASLSVVGNLTINAAIEYVRDIAWQGVNLFVATDDTGGTHDKFHILE